MAVAKKDQERATYAWMYGAQALKDGKERAVPPYWEEHAEAWLQGFDGVPMAGMGKTKTVSDEMEAEVDEAAVDRRPSADHSYAIKEALRSYLSGSRSRVSAFR